MAKDVQKNVEKSTDDPEAEKAFKLASFMSNVCYGKKPQELPLVMKLKSQSPSIPATINTKGVDFKCVISSQNRLVFNYFLLSSENFTNSSTARSVAYQTQQISMKRHLRYYTKHMNC